MEPWLIVIGAVVFIGGIMGSFHYRAVHDFLSTGSVFQNTPPEFLLLPLWGATGIGGLFVVLGFLG